MTAKPRAGLRLRAFTIIETAIEQGVACGWRRAHKHTDDPDESLAIDTIVAEVMGAIAEVIDWDAST